MDGTAVIAWAVSDTWLVSEIDKQVISRQKIVLQSEHRIPIF